MPNLSALRIYIPLLCLLGLAGCNDHSSSNENRPPATTCGIAAANGMPIKLIPFLPRLSFAQPVFMLQAPAGADARWYVLEQGGTIYRVEATAQEKHVLLNLAEFYD